MTTQETKFEYIERNVVLTLENTEPLYRLALEVIDFTIDNNQISNLTSAILKQIEKDSGDDYFPHYSEIQVLKQVVAERVKELQDEAKA